MDEQMKFAFMQSGGVLKDDGMNVDPVSGNNVPSGSLSEEVRDDIPAKLSEGEYVVPADVVRFHGVQMFENLRDQAKQGFGSMEKDGRIGGQPVNEDFPIPMNQLQTFDEGGDTSTYEQTFGQPFTLGQRYGSNTAASGAGYELVTYTSPDGQRTIVIPHFNGKPMSAIPTGFAAQGTQTTGGSGTSVSADQDRQDAENERQQTQSMGQPVTDPFAGQRAQYNQMSQPKSPEEFTPSDFADYYKQTQSFGLDDIARNIPIVGGLLSRQDRIIREQAQKILKDGTQTLDQDQFSAMQKLITTPPQQSFLGSLFGQQQFVVPDDLKGMTFEQYSAKRDDVALTNREDKLYGLDVSAPVPTTVTTAADLLNVDPNKSLSSTEVDNVIKNLGKDSIMTGGIADKMTKAMFGITGGNQIMTPQGRKTATAGQLQGIINNAQNIQTDVQQAVVGNVPTGKDATGKNKYAPDTSRPMGSGPQSVTEIFDRLHGVSQDYTSPSGGGASSAPPDIGNPDSIVANKGVLVTKPKKKSPPKKRTSKKGLGVKTKAT